MAGGLITNSKQYNRNDDMLEDLRITPNSLMYVFYFLSTSETASVDYMVHS